jgi:hypothetical protein
MAPKAAVMPNPQKTSTPSFEPECALLFKLECNYLADPFHSQQLNLTVQLSRKHLCSRSHYHLMISFISQPHPQARVVSNACMYCYRLEFRE